MSVATSNQRAPVVSRPSFHQSVDASRPHVLLTLDLARSGSLHYRYNDTGEEIEVPNIWYNQPYVDRVAELRRQAQLQNESATKFLKYPPLDWSVEAVNNVVNRYRSRAARLLCEADRIEAAGSATHPVSASRMHLSFD